MTRPSVPDSHERGFRDRLSEVYRAADPDSLTEAYNAWAADYDADLLKVQYRIPALVACMVSRLAAPGAGAVLDVGAGTGLLGDLLCPLGYRSLSGVDISSGMLNLAREREVYAELIQADVTRRLPFPDGTFSITAAAGVFGLGHLTPLALPELCRVTASGGVLVFSVSQSAYDQFHFGDALDQLERQGVLRFLAATEPFRMYPGSADVGHLVGRVYGYRIVTISGISGDRE
jgi:predicted TPR repeat methyltransferase